MVRKRVKILIKLLENFETVFKNDELITAIYIYYRYSLKTFNKEISEKKLNKIYDEIKKKETIFREDMNHEIDKILNNKI